MENKPVKLLFIAGPLTTGGDGSREYMANNVQTAESYSVALANAGVAFFCGHTHTSFHHEKGSRAPEDFYYKLDLEILRRAADGVLAIPGWERSYGAKREVEWAITNGLPVFYPKSPDTIDEITAWARQ